MTEESTARNNGTITEGRDMLGRFAPGNPGRPRGSRHKATIAIEALLEGQAEALTQKLIAAALDGDTSALRLCLDRIVPARKDTPVSFEVPEMRTAADASVALGAVLKAVAAGELTPGEGAQIADLIEKFRRTLETEDLEARLASMEDALGRKRR